MWYFVFISYILDTCILIIADLDINHFSEMVLWKKNHCKILVLWFMTTLSAWLVALVVKNSTYLLHRNLGSLKYEVIYI